MSEVESQKTISKTCVSESCVNPANGALTPGHYNFSGWVYPDGTRSRRTRCKMCEAADKAERYRKKMSQSEKYQDPPKKEQDWSEFKKYAWDVRAANNYIRGML